MSRRAEQVVRVSRMLQNDCNVALHAAPGTGKTWLADEVIASLSNTVDIVRVDMSLVRTGSSVLAHIASELGAPTDDAGVHAWWRHLRPILAKRSRTLVVVLDQFDAVIRYPDAPEFLPVFRELVHRKPATHTSAFVVSRRPLESIEAEVRGISELATLCYQEYLGGLQGDDIRALPGAGSLDVSAVQDCLDWSAGYPPLAKYWVSVWPDPPGAAGAHQLAVQFGRLVDYLETMGLATAAAQLVLGPVVDDWIRERRQLDVLGVLDNETTPGYASHAVFRDYLSSRTADLNPWGVLGTAEVRMRELISAIFENEFGTDWPERVSSQNRTLRRAIVAADEKREADVRRFGRAGDWLAYTYPQDLSNLIMGNWDKFSHVFSRGDRRYWGERFSRLAEYRTPVAHNRVEVLSSAQRIQCRLYAEEIIKAIDSHT